MRILHVETWAASMDLARPYTIAFTTINSVENVFVRIVTDAGLEGIGSGAPFALLTGESVDDAERALAPGNLEWLVGADARERDALCRIAGVRLQHFPAARAAVDIALHDLFAKILGLPLARCLGQVHDALPTSVTIGIMDEADAIAAVEEHHARGFRILKVKIGNDVEHDAARLRSIRSHAAPGMRVRCDANQGYTGQQFRALYRAVADLDIEFYEQPFAAADLDTLRALPDELREAIAADESLKDDADALALLTPERACGIFNIKLMKCGGITPARRIATVAELAGIDLMWGCMDESVVSISAALHAAFASPATRYIDLDGSLDLARDVAEGGFVLKDGVMRITDRPGLGVTLMDAASGTTNRATALRG